MVERHLRSHRNSDGGRGSQCLPNGRRRHDAAENGKIDSVWRRQEEIFLLRRAGGGAGSGQGRNPVIAYGREGRYVAWDDAGAKQAVLLSPGTSKPVPLGEQSQFVDLASSGRQSDRCLGRNSRGTKVVRVQVSTRCKRPPASCLTLLVAISPITGKDSQNLRKQTLLTKIG